MAHRVALLGLASVALVSCADLPDYQPGCGNGIIEAGEDCEPSGTSDKTCGAKGTANECLFLCSATQTCPDRMRCGLDGACRRPQHPYALTAGPSLPPGIAKAVHIADFDGDGYADVLSVIPPKVSVDFGAPTTGYSGVRNTITAQDVSDSNVATGAGDLVNTIPFGPVLTTGQLTTTRGPTNVVSSFTVLSSIGIGVVNGSPPPDRALLPAVYASASLRLKVDTLAPISYPRKDPGQLDDGVPYPGAVAFATLPDPRSGKPAVIGLLLRPETNSADPVAAFPLGSILTNVLVGQFSATPKKCDQFIVAVQGTSSVLVFNPCDAEGASTPAAPQVINLPGTVCVGCKNALELLDVDGDGNLDLVVTGTSAPVAGDADAGAGAGDAGPGPGDAGAADAGTNQGTMFVAYSRKSIVNIQAPPATELPPFGWHDGTTPDAPGQAGTVATFPSDLKLLAAADLNFDQVPDLITDRGIWLSYQGHNPPSFFCEPHPTAAAGESHYCLATYSRTPWDSAGVLDLDANGAPDVCLGTSTAAGITCYRNTMSSTAKAFELFADFPVSTLGVVDKFAVGDFDGDGFQDLAFSDAVDNTSAALNASGDSSLSILFGSPRGPSDAPVSMDRLARIDQITPLNAFAAKPDGITDLYVNWVTPDNSATQLALFLGDSNRQILAPHYLSGATTQDGGPILDPTPDANGQADRYDIPIGSAIGNFVSTDHHDLAVLSTYNLWILPMQGNAQIKTSPGPFAMPIDTALFSSDSLHSRLWRPIIARVRPKGAAFDAIVVVSTPPSAFAKDSPAGAQSYLSLAVSHPGGDADAGPQWDLTPPQPIPDGFVIHRPNAELFPSRGGVTLADVDGDGDEDVVLFSGTSGIRVLLNTEIQALAADRSYRLDGSRELVLPVSDFSGTCAARDADGISLDLAGIELDNDAYTELLVAQSSTIETQTCPLTVVKYDAASKKLVVRTDILDPNFKQGGTFIAVGDLNGDGLADVVLGHGNATNPQHGSPQIFLATPAPHGYLSDGGTP